MGKESKMRTVIIATILCLSQPSAFADSAERLLRLLPYGGTSRYLIVTGDRERLLAPGAENSADGYYLLPKRAKVIVDESEGGTAVRVRISPPSRLEAVQPPGDDLRIPRRVTERSAEHLLEQMELGVSQELTQWLRSLPKGAQILFKDPRQARRQVQMRSPDEFNPWA
jgi:hypothetical protein